MMETAVAFWVVASVWVLWWPFLIGLFIIALIVEHNNSHGWMAMWVAAIHIWLFYFFDIGATTAMIYGAMYVPLGVGWSIYRWKRYATRYVNFRKEWAEAHTNSFKGHYRNTEYVFDEDDIRDNLKLTNNKQRLMCWLIGWPISSIEHAIGDMVHQLWVLISVRLGGIYQKITESAISSAVSELKSADTVLGREQIMEDTEEAEAHPNGRTKDGVQGQQQPNNYRSNFR